MTNRILLLLILVGCISITEATGQKSSEAYPLTATQDTLVSQIAKDGTVKGQYVSRIAFTPQQYIRFDSLRRISSLQEMMSLANHPSAAVRIYVFNFLLDNKDWERALQVLQTNYKDETAFYHLYGCIGWVHTVGYFMGLNLKLRLQKENVVLDNKSQKVFESILAKLPSYDKEEKIAKRQMKKVMAQADKVDGILN
ncbi:hypothetical protein [Hymenobacter ruricola]|uniref:Tetratricopeptide repeat protein n=1 Tax=Hymenobacter ruricola TaxID=2791023 RepID=A0ABS0I6Y4_9BACT|nr:hypothetical protein [Hymenobacter ruricola]MBF9222317.1 hypothetical protein [Hymenobacter ruricola]